MSDLAILERLADAIEKRLNPVVPLSVALWDVERIANYLVRSPKVVRERVVNLPDFPKPIRIPSVQSGGGRQAKALPRWKAAEVIAWTESYRDKPLGRPRKAAD
nr:hypothetical protein [uncultured Cupriavidus sp.]